ncbi:MAG: hypothetical protein J7578_06265 [Chitinophagaceae bacterium]|nr:hypothetical protein [Chitinophagaceae bacterium]
MASIEEVESFLVELKIKLSIWGVVFRNEREKNLHSILLLELTTPQRVKILEELRGSDYCEGPKPNGIDSCQDLWVFGVFIKSREIYIKLTMGFKNEPVRCISFHIAEYPLRYPFK